MVWSILNDMEEQKTKCCSRCRLPKLLNEFGKLKSSKDGLKPICKECKKIYDNLYREKNREIINKKSRDKWKDNPDLAREKKKKYYQTNIEKEREQRRIYRENNKEKEKLRHKKYQEKNPNANKIYYEKNRKKCNERSKNYRKQNWEKIKQVKNKANKKRRLVDPIFKLRMNIGKSIYDSIKRNNFTKKSKTQEILGCLFDEFKQHIELKWEPWMNWENYGHPKDKILEPNKTWDIDHIVPTSSAETEEDIIRLNHHTNLQPLCSYINRIIKRANNDYNPLNTKN